MEEWVVSFPLSEKADTGRGEGCHVRMRRRQVSGSESAIPGEHPSRITRRQLHTALQLRNEIGLFIKI